MVLKILLISPTSNVGYNFNFLWSLSVFIFWIGNLTRTQDLILHLVCLRRCHLSYYSLASLSLFFEDLLATYIILPWLEKSRHWVLKCFSVELFDFLDFILSLRSQGRIWFHSPSFLEEETMIIDTSFASITMLMSWMTKLVARTWVFRRNS